MKRLPGVILLAALGLLPLAGCIGGTIARAAKPRTGGNASRGARLIEQYRCGACHTIPGIRDAKGLVGPPLFFFSRRTYIAGEAPNTAANLERWIESPQSIEPNTAMPTLGIGPRQARDIAAYLYTLK